MGIQCQYGNAWTRDAEVAFQCRMENGRFLHDTFFGDGTCNVFDSQVCRDEGHTQRLVHQYHQGFLSVAHAGLDIFRMTREMETRSLDGRFVDGGGHQHVV